MFTLYRRLRNFCFWDSDLGVIGRVFCLVVDHDLRVHRVRVALSLLEAHGVVRSLILLIGSFTPIGFQGSPGDGLRISGCLCEATHVVARLVREVVHILSED